MNGILNPMPPGILSDPRQAAMLQAGLGLLASSGPSRTPVGLGQAIGQAGMQGINAFHQTNQANQQNQMFQMKLAEVQREAEERKRREADLAALERHPSLAGLPPELLRVAPNVAFDRAFPKPAAPAGDDDFTRALRGAGIQPWSPEWIKAHQDRLTKLSSHAPAPSATATARADNKAGESLGKEIGPMLAESRTGALAASQIVDTTHRIGQALESGQVNLGPGATVKTRVEQVARLFGAGGRDVQERLVNTRNVIRGLAQLTVANRKALKGQGTVTDNEQKLLERAEAGNIDDFTMDELRDFINVSERLARTQYAIHELNMKNASSNESTKGLASFFRVPALPAARGGAVNPVIQQLLDKYAPVNQ
jgi:hypothetical protein